MLKSMQRYSSCDVWDLSFGSTMRRMNASLQTLHVMVNNSPSICGVSLKIVRLQLRECTILHGMKGVYVVVDV